jgi:aminoglycoside/choline kinase family phosphotransferase
MPHMSVEALKRAIFPVAQELIGGHDPRLETLEGGASIRRYHRITLEGGRVPSLVVMELGDNPLKSEEAGKAAAPTELPFINVQRYLVRAGAAVPEIMRYDVTLGLLYIEDLGDITFESRVLAGDDDVRARYYRLAIDQLVALQDYALAHPDSDCIAFSRGFDYDLLKWELDHFREYGLEAQGHELTAPEREEVERVFARIAEELAAQPRGFVHRDYQSRNLMVQDAVDEPHLRLIDFQDALLGPRVYDLVGLLRDSYVALSPTLLDSLVGHFVARAGLDSGSFGRLFDLQVVQRKLKDSGRFVFIDRVKHNPSFLKHIPNSLAYVARSLARLPELASLREILARKLPELGPELG